MHEFPLPETVSVVQPGGPAPGRLVLPPRGECHLWLVPVGPRAGWREVLDAAERLRAEQLASTPAGDTFVTSRATQRLVGAGYLGIAPRLVETDRTCQHCGAPKHGRPRYKGVTVDYSVSHTERWVAMVVAGRGLVGVDIEDGQRAYIDGLPRAILTAAEKRDYDLLPPAGRTARLLTAWTRKEAAVKLTGLGLQAPPNRIGVRGPVVTAAGVPRWPAGPIYLYGLPAPEEHLLAVATTVPLLAVRRFEVLGGAETAGAGVAGPSPVPGTAGLLCGPELA